MRTTKPIIAPSVLSADFSRLGDEIKAVEKAGADWIHLDVMDGHFVPNITIGPILVEAARKSTNLCLDTHLMIENPGKYVDDFIKAGADSITVHVEVFSNPEELKELLQSLRAKKVKAGLSLNPATPVAKLLPFLSYTDLILVMTVNPGFGGQSFMSACLEKVQELRKMREQENHSFLIEVDGGVNQQTIASCAQAGADAYVAGSAIFKTADYHKTINELRALAVAS